jgi:transcriptional regulator with XRE-family HTH domain
MRNGRQLKAARILAGLTQRQLASRANLHVNSVKFWERKTSRIDGHAVSLIAQALATCGVETDEEIIGGRLLVVLRGQF